MNKFFIIFLVLGVILAGCSSNTLKGVESKEKEPITDVVDNGQKEELNGEAVEEQIAQYYFTANEGGSISKVDASSNSLVSEIKVDGSVHNVQVSPDGKMLGATVVPNMRGHAGHGGGHSEGMNGKALFYDIESEELLKEVEVGNHPAHIVFTKDGNYAVVTNNEDNNISVIDTENFTIAETVETGKGPHGFRISDNSQKVYIANMEEDTVSVVNLDTMTEERRIKVGASPITTGTASDGKILVASLNGENALAVVDLETEKVDKIEVGTGPAQVYIDGNDQFAYVANQGTEEAPSKTVTVVDLSTKKVTATIETGKGSHGVVASPDSKRVYVTNMFENTVSVIDTEQNKVVETIGVGDVPNGISITE